MTEPASAPAEKTTVPEKGSRRWLVRVVETFAGSGLGFVVWTLLGPGIIGGLYAPLSRDAFSCEGSVRSALERFVFMQAICAVGGAALVAATLFFGRRWWARRAQRKAMAPSA